MSTPTTAPLTPLTPLFAPAAQEHFTDPTATVQVRHDLFPSEVTFTTASGATAAAIQLPKCRTLITPTAVYVFTDGPRGPVLAFYDELAALTGDRLSGFTVTPASPTATGVSSLTVAPTNRCGCGSRLRGYRPFGRISYVPST